MFRSITLAAIIVAIPAEAIAQTDINFGPSGLNDSRATLGVTIPFGKRNQTQDRKPQLELGFDHRSNRDALHVAATQLRGQDITKVRIGLSLSDDPHVMLNGRAVQNEDGRYNLSTIASVGIGIVVVAGTGALVLNQLLADASD
jgi:hypothetical protein